MELEYIKPIEIEARSMEIIDKELKDRGIILEAEKAPFIKRAIHTSADFEYAETLCFSEGAVATLKKLLKEGANIVTDTSMAFSGINKSKVHSFGGETHCFIDKPDINYAAHDLGVTRSYLCMKYAMRTLEGPVIFVVGNAPTALIAIKEAYDEGKYTSAFVIGVPVGFVNVVQSKELIMETKIPFIVNRGRKGGSNVAAALINAALYSIDE